MKNKSELGLALGRGLSFLERTALENGSYDSYTFASPDMTGEREPCPTPFITFCVIQAVGPLLSQKLRDKVMRYVCAERGTNAAYNYWERLHPRFHSEPYPDDLDDTACAISARIILGETLTGDELGKFAKLLIACERTVGGPYKTWLAPETAGRVWKDIDPIVNANIAFALKLVGTELPNLTEYLRTARGKRSPYYAPSTLLDYCLARAGVIDTAPLVLEGTVLENALGVAAYLRCGGNPSDCLSILTLIQQAQHADGGWGYEPYITGDGHHWTGSRAYTTAICCEAINAYVQATQAAVPLDAERDAVQDVADATNRIVETWPATVRKEGKRYVSTFLASKDGRSIALLPLAFNAGLPEASRQQPEVVIRFCTATVAGWIAYTLIDDICDEDTTAIGLPFAQLFLQSVNACYYTVAPTQWITTYYTRVMNELDASYAWELAATRNVARSKLPKWGRGQKLAQRSFAHALGPLATLCLSGYAVDSPEVMQTEKWFRHYVIARQLTDDMHDWREDLEHGALTLVTTRLVEGWQRGNGPVTEACPSQLSLYFWQHVAPDVADLILYHCKRARVAARHPLLKNQKILDTELLRIEGGAHLALKERERVQAFSQQF